MIFKYIKNVQTILFGLHTCILLGFENPIGFF